MSVSVNSSQYPVSTILLFAVDNDFTLYFATHSDSFKAKALAENNKMSISVWEHHKMLVQGYGDVHKLEDADEIAATLDKLAVSVVRIGDFWPPVLRVGGSGYSVYRLKLKHIRALDLVSENIKERELPFTSYDLS